MSNPYGQCHHTKHLHSQPCIHDAWEAGREAAAKQQREAAHIYEMGYRDGYAIGHGDAIRSLEALTHGANNLTTHNNATNV